MPGSGPEPGDGGTGGVPKRSDPPGNGRGDEAATSGRRPFAVLGCLMTVAGFFSGAMVAVLVAKVRSAVIHCTPVDPELPACNWQQFAGVGGLLGALTLPILVYWRLRTSASGRRDDAAAAGDRDL